MKWDYYEQTLPVSYLFYERVPNLYEFTFVKIIM
jgi:hypothetical protein